MPSTPFDTHLHVYTTWNPSHLSHPSTSLHPILHPLRHYSHLRIPSHPLYTRVQSPLCNLQGDANRLNTIRDLKAHIKQLNSGDRSANQGTALERGPSPVVKPPAMRDKPERGPGSGSHKAFVVIVELQQARQHLQSLPRATRQALQLVQSLVQRLLTQHGGRRTNYPVEPWQALQRIDTTPPTPPICYMALFNKGLDALSFAITLQEQLLVLPWDEKVLLFSSWLPLGPDDVPPLPLLSGWMTFRWPSVKSVVAVKRRDHQGAECCNCEQCDRNSVPTQAHRNCDTGPSPG